MRPRPGVKARAQLPWPQGRCGLSPRRCLKRMGRGVWVAAPQLCGSSAKPQCILGCGHVPNTLDENWWWSQLADPGLAGTQGKRQRSTCMPGAPGILGPAPSGAPDCGGGLCLNAAKTPIPRRAAARGRPPKLGSRAMWAAAGEHGAGAPTCCTGDAVPGLCLQSSRGWV